METNPKVILMEKRIGAILIVVHSKQGVNQLNDLISKHSHLILGRQGLPLNDRSISVISLVIEGSTDEIGAFTGPMGRISGITVKSIVVPPNFRSNTEN